VVVFGALLLAHRRLGAVAVVAALHIGFTRVHIAAHYPWDVVAGLVLGAAVSLLGWLHVATPLPALTRWLRTIPGLLGAFADHSEKTTPTTPTGLSRP
jgi:undecaprenyl-diphosphatase